MCTTRQCFGKHMSPSLSLLYQAQFLCATCRNSQDVFISAVIISITIPNSTNINPEKIRENALLRYIGQVNEYGEFKTMIILQNYSVWVHDTSVKQHVYYRAVLFGMVLVFKWGCPMSVWTVLLIQICSSCSCSFSSYYFIL